MRPASSSATSARPTPAASSTSTARSPVLTGQPRKRDGPGRSGPRLRTGLPDRSRPQDTEPILSELRQERAGSLFGEAKRFYTTGELEKAQTVLGEVFDLDPANREARQLRDSIQTELLGRVIRPKVEALLRKAEDALVDRRFDEAIESLKTALRLDRTNQQIPEKLEQARQRLATNREVARLISDAHRQFSKGNLEEALAVFPEILERDPGNPEALRLLEEVRAALTQRDKEREYQEKLQLAKDLLQANSFDESTGVLEDLDPEFKTREEVKSLTAQIRSRKEAFEGEQQLKGEMAAVEELLAGANFEAAIKRLEVLMNRFPQEVEPTKLFIAAHRELAAYRKAEALNKLTDELKRLADKGHFERALALIGQSLRTYQSEPRLLEAQQQIQAEWARYKRQLAVRRIVEEAERHLARKEIEKAVYVLEAGDRQYPSEAELTKSQ